MTVEEFTQLAAAIKTYFPRDNILPTKQSMELWYDMLKDMDYKNAYIGLKNHVATSRFAPTIADIRNGASVTQPQELNEMEAWSLVSKAIRNSGYNSAEEYSKLPPIVQKSVGLPSQLRMWALDEDYNEIVVSSNFIKTYRNEVARQHEFSKIPTEVKQLIQNATQGSYSSKMDDLRKKTIKSLNDGKESGIKEFGDVLDAVSIPRKCKKVMEDMREFDKNNCI